MLDQLLAAGSMLRPATGGAQTMVMPRGGQTSGVLLGAPFSALTAEAETQILGAATLLPTDPDAPHDLVLPGGGTVPNGVLLAKKARGRKKRGYWLFLIVLFLATAIGSTGWYFGSGPGSEVTVPTTLVGSTPDEAASQLLELGLIAEPGSVYSATIAAGLVTGTEPAAGTRLPQDSVVKVIVSLGLQPITLPALAGLSQGDAETTITAVTAVVGTIDAIFDADADTGVVLAATKASDGGDLSGGGEYFQGLTVDLVVSLGAIPAVAGETVGEATAILAEKGLLVTRGSESYHDSIPEGSVIRGTAPDGQVRAGATITLTISRGPEPVEVPNVVAMGWNEGKQALLDLGFVLDYQFGADTVAPLLTVESTDPAAGQSVPRGSTITMTPRF